MDSKVLDPNTEPVESVIIQRMVDLNKPDAFQSAELIRQKREGNTTFQSGSYYTAPCQNKGEPLGQCEEEYVVPHFKTPFNTMKERSGYDYTPEELQQTFYFPLRRQNLKRKDTSKEEAYSLQAANLEAKIQVNIDQLVDHNGLANIIDNMKLVQKVSQINPAKHAQSNFVVNPDLDLVTSSEPPTRYQIEYVQTHLYQTHEADFLPITESIPGNEIARLLKSGDIPHRLYQSEITNLQMLKDRLTLRDLQTDAVQMYTKINTPHPVVNKHPHTLFLSIPIWPLFFNGLDTNEFNKKDGLPINAMLPTYLAVTFSPQRGLSIHNDNKHLLPTNTYHVKSTVPEIYHQLRENQANHIECIQLVTIYQKESDQRYGKLLKKYVYPKHGNTVFPIRRIKMFDQPLRDDFQFQLNTLYPSPKPKYLPKYTKAITVKLINQQEHDEHVKGVQNLEVYQMANYDINTHDIEVDNKSLTNNMQPETKEMAWLKLQRFQQLYSEENQKKLVKQRNTLFNFQEFPLHIMESVFDSCTFGDQHKKDINTHLFIKITHVNPDEKNWTDDEIREKISLRYTVHYDDHIHLRHQMMIPETAETLQKSFEN